MMTFHKLELRECESTFHVTAAATANRDIFAIRDGRALL